MKSSEINALPDRVRRYIHDIETRCDPTGEVQTIWSQREQIGGLVARLDGIKADAPEIARQIDSLYEEASNNPCTCATDESSCPCCNAWGAARSRAAELIAEMIA